MSMRPNHVIGTADFIALPRVFIDLETTGDSLAEGGEVCEAGLVKVDPVSGDALAELNLMFGVANPFGRSEEELSYHRYNGFTFAEWVDAILAEQALDQLNAFCAGCVPWAYNVSFEFRWLADYFYRYGRDWQGDYHWHCLMTKASEALRPDFLAGRITKLSLSSVGAYLGLGEEAKPHRGLTGARYEVQIDARLNTRRQSAR